METLVHYRQIIQQVLNEYAQIPHAYGDIQNIVVSDDAGDHYLWMSMGWEGSKRIYNCLAHIDIINGKIWIQRDQTEDGLALDLERAGVPKDHIVLGFRSAEVRPYTDYAIA